ncbi:TPA: hypothetical protein RJD49_002926 [Legionella pneumophila]|nr:hypothetical protein [Legionella pneumophila]HDV5713828.1 hypothetical protein [Legionella pneumophila]HDV5807076.1 hypothetical protein [Legionella pneumophila]HEO1456011.1 hypothetical protein [Legionella pneumophila]HEO1459162.1 hypothetical protein [Legionella pneumophila]
MVAKILTARRLQQQIGGEIVFFYHDSDHDPRETRTILLNHKTGRPALLNFSFENKVQRKFSPLYAKRIPIGWQDKTIAQLTNYVGKQQIQLLKETSATNIAEFCLEMYKHMGLLEGIKIIRSSDRMFRKSACDISDFFVDIKYSNETVRARYNYHSFKLHVGGDVYLDVPLSLFSKEQISPCNSCRLVWMQSVIHCTHYVTGSSENQYLNKFEAPEISFISRDTIERPNEAYTECKPISTSCLWGPS